MQQNPMAALMPKLNAGGMGNGAQQSQGGAAANQPAVNKFKLEMVTPHGSPFPTFPGIQELANSYPNQSGGVSKSNPIGEMPIGPWSGGGGPRPGSGGGQKMDFLQYLLPMLLGQGGGGMGQRSGQAMGQNGGQMNPLMMLLQMFAQGRGR